MAIVAIFGLLILALMFLPQLWVRNVISRHSKERSDIPGTGADLARHLLAGMKLGHVTVEETQLGDHYDPEAKAVRLSASHYHGRSLSAVVIAAHEVGHAMQDATGYAPLKHRTRIAKMAVGIQNVAFILLLATPVLVVLAKSPSIMILQLAAGVMMIASTVLMHLTTLPVEFDASFKRALPVLEQGGYLQQSDMPAARELLRAAAFTYVAAAAISLLDIVRWLRILRF
ncbi:MAG: zinc metallopeptidase [Hyphomicrobiaceae bacterium]